MNESVFNNSVKAGPPQVFDPHRMPEAVKVVAPVNTRTFLYHATKPEIVIEGKGANDAEIIADFKVKLAEKLKLGYSTERQQHGTHPHSNDTHRLEMQQVAAANGDKAAQAALDAKSAKTAAPISAEDLKTENELMAERIAKLEAQLEHAKLKETHKK